jgi:hypothetical protein
MVGLQQSSTRNVINMFCNMSVHRISLGNTLGFCVR